MCPEAETYMERQMYLGVGASSRTKRLDLGKSQTLGLSLSLDRIRDMD